MGAGGIEAIICGLSNELAKAHEVTVCTLRQPVEGEVFYERLAPAVRKETIGKTEATSPVKVVFQVYKYLKKSDFDVVHIHCFFYFYILAVLLLHRKKRFFYTVHNDAEKENMPWDRRLLAIKRFCFRKGWIHPVTISPASQESFYRLYHCDSTLIQNGTPRPAVVSAPVAAPYRLTPRTRVLVNPARIDPQKNQGMLCRVVDRLVREGHDICLVIAGPNHKEVSYREMEPFFSDRIRYIGECADIPSLLHDADGMVLSSVYEGMPVVIIEAFAVGCPCICTPVGGIVNMIEDGVNGFLSTEVSEEAYYAALHRFLSLTEEENAALRRRTQDSFEPYDIARMASDYQQCYLHE